MKNYISSDVLALLLIMGIGFFELFYRKNLTDGYLALGMALSLFIYQRSDGTGRAGLNAGHDNKKK